LPLILFAAECVNYKELPGCSNKRPRFSVTENALAATNVLPVFVSILPSQSQRLVAKLMGAI